MGHTRQPTLTASDHPVMVNFDHSRNQEAGLDPDKITLGSHKRVHWICSNCPRGQPHLWMATPNMRTSNKRGCPYCSSVKACVCNSLQSLYPALAAEWDTASNGVGLDQILPASHKSAYWKDAVGNNWEQSPHGHTRLLVGEEKRAMIKARNVSSALVSSCHITSIQFVFSFTRLLLRLVVIILFRLF